MGVSRALITENIQRGNLLINGSVITKPSQTVKEGDKASGIVNDPRQHSLEPVESRLDILFEDDALLILNKPQGVVVHPASSHRGDTLVHHVLYHLKSLPDFKTLSDLRPGIIHRLDKGTSGVILIAKNRQALDFVSKQFKARTVDKQYECLVWGTVGESGSYTQAIGRSTLDPKRMSLKSRSLRAATTHWKRLHLFKHFSHLEVYPKTGRTHQIRVHLSQAGHPIVGDGLYGRPNIQKRISPPPDVSDLIQTVTDTFLHARHITFVHPVTLSPISIEAKRPPLFDKMLDLLNSYDQ